MKQNGAFRSYSFYHRKNSRQGLHEIFLKPQYKCAEVPRSSISTHSFSFSVNLCFMRIYQLSHQNQQNDKQIYGVHIPRKCIESGHFYSFLSPLKTRSQIFAITPQAKENYSFPQVAFFPKSVFHKAERGGGIYDLLYENSFRKYEDDLRHQVINILYDLQFFEM